MEAAVSMETVATATALLSRGGPEAFRGGIHAISRGSSPLSRRTGSAAIHASISVESHIDLPPTMRERGNFPSRIQVQIVGKLTPVIAITLGLSSSRALGMPAAFNSAALRM